MEQLRGLLARRGPRPVPAREKSLRRAGVVVPLFVREGQLWILFTRRTETLEHHRGQISFPGGAEEPGDEHLLATALRETEEELGIAAEDAKTLGALSPLVTITNFYVEPFVAAIPQPYVFRPAADEIAEVLEVPVAALMDPSIREAKRIEGRPEPVLFFRYGDHVIWGVTGQILDELLGVLKGR
jgi:8-oxo-dGTP pyrophosphatase MutT (NUDIX family)